MGYLYPFYLTLPVPIRTPTPVQASQPSKINPNINPTNSNCNSKMIKTHLCFSKYRTHPRHRHSFDTNLKSSWQQSVGSPDWL